MKDLVIIGAGPAGLSAALNAAHLKLDTLLIESSAAGGLPLQNYPWKEIDSYLGMCGMPGKELAEKMVSQIPDSIEIRENEPALEVKKLKTGFKVRTTKGTYTAKTVIIAIGVMGQPRSIGVEGEGLEGVCTAIEDLDEFKGKKVAVIGGGDTAVEYAVNLSRAGAKTWLMHRRDSFRATGSNVKELSNTKTKILFNSEVKKLSGTKRVEKITYVNNKTGKEQTLKMDYVFKCIGNIPSKDFLEKTGIQMDNGHPVVKPDLGASIPGIYLAGDITKDLMKISQAVAEGNRALLSAYTYLKSPYWAEKK